MGDVMYQRLMRRRCYLIIILFCVAVVWGGAGCARQRLAPGMSVVKGKVRVVNVEQSTLLIVPPKGGRVLVSVGINTEIKGYQALQFIRKGDPVEVIYRGHGKDNTAVSIKKITPGSC